jgi:sugar-specific transcriptional regulator TrmB
VIRAIKALGLSEFDAQVYVFLALNGPKQAKEINVKIKLSKQQIYRSLKNLEENNIVVASGEVPAVFSAASFEKVLALLSIKKEGQAEAFEKVRQDLLDSWQKIIVNNSTNASNSLDRKADC